MVIQHRNEYHLLRLSENMVKNPPLLMLLGCHPEDPEERWLPGSVNQTAVAATQLGWSLNVVTYSWNVETMELAFRIKQSPLPKLPGYIYCYSMVGADIMSGRVVLLLLNSPESKCIILDTV